MRLRFGYGGWVGIDGLGLPGPLYVRMRKSASSERLLITDVYLDGSRSEVGIARRDIRDLPLSQIDGFINEHPDKVLKHIDRPAPDLSTLAGFLDTEFMGFDPRHWVNVAFTSQMPREQRLTLTDEQGREEVLRLQTVTPPLESRWEIVTEDRDFRLDPTSPQNGLTDEFLRDVARAYRAALARGERYPNQEIAKQTNYDPRSVQRWVYTARQRRIMPPGRKGAAG